MTRINEQWDIFSHADAAHVIPRYDTRPHDPTVTCWCQPHLETDLWVHHARDGREAFEISVAETKEPPA
jgi:hypothetical protein